MHAPLSLFRAALPCEGTSACTPAPTRLDTLPQSSDCGFVSLSDRVRGGERKSALETLPALW